MFQPRQAFIFWTEPPVKNCIFCPFIVVCISGGIVIVFVVLVLVTVAALLNTGALPIVLVLSVFMVP